MGNLVHLAEGSTPTITLDADWYKPVLDVVVANAPAILGGGIAIMAVGVGIAWLLKNVRKVAK